MEKLSPSPASISDPNAFAGETWYGALAARLHTYPMLAGCGWVNFGLALVMLLLYLADERQLAGVNPWLKPIKYALATSLYTWTLALILSSLQDFEKLRGVIAKAVAGLMLIQIMAISIQAALGFTSHYNVTTSWDQWMFGTIGLCAALNTLFAGLALGLILTVARPMPAGIVAGMRLGMLLFVAASFQGFQMLMNQAHTVGADDGTPGIAFLNWSLTHGDLRVAHVIGLFALPLLPILGGLANALKLPAKAQTVFVIACAVGCGWLALHANSLAMAGKPFLK